MFPTLPSSLTLLVYALLTLITLGVAIALGVLLVKLVLRIAGAIPSLLRWGVRRLQGMPTTFGSARFATPRELRRSDLMQGHEGLVLAQWQGHPLSTPGAGAHMLVVSPPDGGKSTGPAACTLLSWPQNCVVLDPKGELYPWTAGYRQSLGQRVIRFAPTEAETHHINLLDLIRVGTPDEVADARTLGTSLINPAVGDQSKGEEVFWQQSAVAFLSTLLLFIAYEGPRRSLAGCRDALTDPMRPVWHADPEHDTLLRAMRRSTHEAIRRGAQELQQRSDRNVSGVLSEITTCLAWLAEPNVAAATDSSDLDLEDLQHRPLTLYVQVSIGGLARLHPLVRALIETTVYRLTEHATDWHQRECLWLLDEVALLGHCSILTQALPAMRGHGLKAMLLWQDLPQILARYGPYHSFLALCAIQLYLNPSDELTAQSIAKRLGMTTIVRHSPSISTGPLGLGPTSESLSEQQSARQLMLADELMQLPADQAILLAPGLRPALVQRIRYFEQPTFAARAQGQPEPVVVLAKPMLRKVAALVGALLVAGSLSVWALWPTPATVPPRLSLTSEAGGMPAASPAGSMTADPTPPTPQARTPDPEPPSQGLSFAERWAYLRPEPKPWAIWRDTRGFGYANESQREPRLSRFATVEQCQADLATYLDQLDQQIATTSPGTLTLKRLGDGRYQQTFGGMGGHAPPTVTFRCLREGEGPS